MVDLLAIATQPLVALLAAVALLIGRTILHAKRLKTAARDPDLAKIMMAGQSPTLLKSHEESLKQAKTATSENLAQAQRILRNYTKDFKRLKQKKT